jgi:hypothetical protein
MIFMITDMKIHIKVVSNTTKKHLKNETQTNIHRNSDNDFILHRFSNNLYLPIK